MAWVDLTRGVLEEFAERSGSVYEPILYRIQTLFTLLEERHLSAKLTAASVTAIRLSPETDRALAKRFNVSHVTIHKVRTFKTWKRVLPKPKCSV
jgi:hypothetical protein